MPESAGVGESAYFEQLWVNGRRADRARIPNRVPQNLTEEYFHVASSSCANAKDAAHTVELVTITNAGAEALWRIPDDEQDTAQMCVVHKWSFARRSAKGSRRSSRAASRSRGGATRAAACGRPRSPSKKLDRAARTVETHGRSVWAGWQNWNPRETRNEIAFNKIYDLGKGIMSDMGGVYTLGTSYGTTVHDNVIHDVWSYTYGGWALYTDEGSEGIVMERNLCWNTTDGGFHQHYGAGCVIRNNIFAWNRKLGAVRMRRQVVQDIPCTLHFVNNIVVVKEGPLVGRGPRGVGGIWAGNLWYDYSGKPELDGLDWNAWKDCGKEVLGRYADPLFEDAEAFDFRLKPESPAFALGFKAWDYSKAGIRR